MKYVFLFLIILCTIQLHAQGKYAGSMKALVGKSYADSKKIPGLKGWRFMQGDLISPIDDVEATTVDVYVKGTTAIVLFSIKELKSAESYIIADLVEIKNMAKGWTIKTGTCREGSNDDVTLVALVKETMAERLTNVKQAWRCNRDKRRIEAVPIKNVSCLNEGAEQF